MDVFQTLVKAFELPADHTMHSIISTLLLFPTDSESKSKSTECLLTAAAKSGCRPILNDLLTTHLIPLTETRLLISILETLVRLLVIFGNEYFPVQDYAEQVAKLAGVENVGVQEAVTSYMKEAWKWDRVAVLEVIEMFGEEQKEELRTWFEGPKDVCKTDSVVPHELSDSLHLELLKAEDSSERCEILEEISRAVDEGLIRPESVASLSKAIKELIQDFNPLVSKQALKTFGQLAEAFKGHFAEIEGLKLALGKCTEESTAASARSCLKSLMLSLSTQELTEAIKDILTNSNNLVIVEICLCITDNIIPGAEFSLIETMNVEINPILASLASDDSAEVRKAASDCLTSMKWYSNSEVSSKRNIALDKQEVNEFESNVSPSQTTSGIPNKGSKCKLYRSEKAEEEARTELESECRKLLEEDVERAVSASEATKQVFEVMPTEILALFDMNEWSERLKGLQNLNAWIAKNADRSRNEGRVKRVVEALIMWLKRKFDDFRALSKEAVKELLTLFKTFCNKCELNTKSAREIIAALMSQIANIELTNTCVDIIVSVARSISPAFVVALVMKSCHESSLIKEGLLVLNKMLALHGAAPLPCKLAVYYAKQCLGSEDLAMQNEAIQCIAAVYKVKGEEVAAWLSDLNEAIYKKIEERLSKVQIEEQVAEECEGSLNCRVDITTQLTQKTVMGLSAPLSKHRQEAKNEVERIIVSANSCIKSAGLAQLFMALKGRMKEPCKNLAKSFIALIGNLATAMGQGFGQYTKIILQPFLQTLLDKQSIIRAEALLTLEKIHSSLGLEPLLSGIARLLAADSSYGKAAILGWLLGHKEELAGCEVRELVEALGAVEQERSAKELAERTVKEVKTLLGDDEFGNLVQELSLPARINIENLLQDHNNEEVRGELEGGVRVRSRGRLGEMHAGKNRLKSSFEVSHTSLHSTPVKFHDSKSKAAQCTAANLSSRIPGVGSANRARENYKSCNFARSKSNLRRAALDCSTLSNRSSRDLSQTRKLGGMSSSRSTNDLQKQFHVRLKTSLHEPRKTQDKESLNESAPENFPENVVVAALGNKPKRAEQDKKLKWSITEVRSANVEKLKKTLKNCLNQSVFEWMFSAQFKKNLNAISALNEALKTEFPSLLDLLDLLLKWVAMKLIEQPNAAVVKEVLEFLAALFGKIAEAQYCLLDFEASAIVPLLCEKLGISNTTFRQQIKELLRMSSQFYSPAKITSYLTSTLDATNNRRTKIECLKLAKEFIKKHDTSKSLTPKDVRTIIKLVNSSDSDLKNDSLDIMAELYNARGDSLWMLVGQLTEKTDELLKKRFNADESASMRREKCSVSSNDDLFVDVSESRARQRKSASKQKNTPVVSRLESSLRKNSMERERRLLGTPTVEKEFMSPSETESLFSTTGRLEENYRTSRMHVSSIDSSQTQEEEAIEVESLQQALEILKNGSITKRVNALMYLNEKTVSTLEEEKECLIEHSDQLIITFADILRELFDKPMEDIPVRFAKYFMTVVSKVCANKNVIQHVSEKCFYVFIEQILMKLLYDNLENMGENNEGQYLIKALNLTILRILELYDPTKLFSVFIHLFMKYKDIAGASIKTAKLPSLVAKCILKLAKSMSTLVEHLNVPKILLSLHEYLLLIPPSAIPKSANDDIGIRMAKTIIYELIKIRGESIWEDYKVVELHKKPDLHLQRWVSHILGSFSPTSFSPIRPCEETEEDSFDELQLICRGLNSQETFQKSIQKLSEYSRSHQNLDLPQYFANYSKPFREFILSSLERYNSQCKGSVTPFERRNVANAPKGGSSVSEYKNKLEFLKQKFDIKGKEDKGRKFLTAMNNMIC